MPFLRLSLRAVIAGAACCVMAWSSAAARDTVQIEDMTSPELRARIDAGSTTILIPIGGTEQNGPYIALGKHNVRARFFAEAIARRLGHALVAPVVAYVPEGAVTPPAAHMRFAGTISIPDAAFDGMLDGAARSFCQHGLRDIVFVGDHGGYQKNLQRVAASLNRAWSRHSCRAHALPEFYGATQDAYVAALKSRGLTGAEIGQHAGVADTSLTLAVDAALVRTEALARAGKPVAGDGTDGDPRKSSRALGEVGVARIVDAAVAALQGALGKH